MSFVVVVGNQKDEDERERAQTNESTGGTDRSVSPRPVGSRFSKELMQFRKGLTFPPRTRRREREGP